MKKILMAAALAVAVAAGLTGCASNKGTLSGVEQAKAAQRPGWANAQVTFNSDDAAAYEARVLSESGLYATGLSEDLGNTRITAQAAALSARTQLGSYVGAQIGQNLQRKDTISGTLKTGLTNEEMQLVNSNLKGARPVDSFTDEKSGDVYVLMFVSYSNLKNSLSNVDGLKDIVNEYLKSTVGQ